MQAAELNPEMVVVEADALESAEGNTFEANRRGAAPEACLEGSAGIVARGMRGEGRRGTWEVPSSPSRDGTAEQARVSEVGRAGRRSAP